MCAVRFFTEVRSIRLAYPNRKDPDGPRVEPSKATPLFRPHDVGMTSRISVFAVLGGRLLVTGVWHAAHAEFHAHATDIVAAADAASPAKPAGDIDHSGDTLVHPMHQQAFLYRIELAAPFVRADFVVDDYLNRFVAGYTSRLFRPPAI